MSHQYGTEHIVNCNATLCNEQSESIQILFKIIFFTFQWIWMDNGHGNEHWMHTTSYHHASRRGPPNYQSFHIFVLFETIRCITLDFCIWVVSSGRIDGKYKVQWLATFHFSFLRVSLVIRIDVCSYWISSGWRKIALYRFSVCAVLADRNHTVNTIRAQKCVLFVQTDVKWHSFDIRMRFERL